MLNVPYMTVLEYSESIDEPTTGQDGGDRYDLLLSSFFPLITYSVKWTVSSVTSGGHGGHL